MIRYSISREDLERRIEEQKKGWLKRARKRTDGFREKRAYAEKASIWSEVKVVYMRLQGGSKCAFCERKLEAEIHGKGEQHVEHFRPKGGVYDWPDGADLDVSLTAASGGGYYLLPYHPFNYAASCGPCNSGLKGNYFPIAGSYQLDGAEPVDLGGERAYLIYPIGDLDADPEHLIEFYGVMPRPIPEDGFTRDRARVSIRFFRLDDAVERGNLVLERARMIAALFPQLEEVHGYAASENPALANQVVIAYTRDSSPHTNCCRSFLRLYARDRMEARTVYEKAREFIATKS